MIEIDHCILLSLYIVTIISLRANWFFLFNVSSSLYLSVWLSIRKCQKSDFFLPKNAVRWSEKFIYILISLSQFMVWRIDRYKLFLAILNPFEESFSGKTLVNTIKRIIYMALLLIVLAGHTSVSIRWSVIVARSETGLHNDL